MSLEMYLSFVLSFSSNMCTLSGRVGSAASRLLFPSKLDLSLDVIFLEHEADHLLVGVLWAMHIFRLCNFCFKMINNVAENL